MPLGAVQDGGEGVTDREKVVNGLEHAVEVFDGRIFGPMYDMWMDATKDALALLKAQEPVEATVCNNDISGAGSWWYQCGKCKMPIDPKDRFCRHCGQAVKWE